VLITPKVAAPSITHQQELETFRQRVIRCQAEAKRLLAKLYTFSLPFPQCFPGSSREASGRQWTLHSKLHIMIAINHLGVIDRVPLPLESISKMVQIGFAVEASFLSSSQPLRDLDICQP
jgi:hypothetical protein